MKRHDGAPRGAGFGHFMAAKPSKLRQAVAPCAYCAARSMMRCEFPSCFRPMCRRHAIRKFGGTLCRDHEGAMLLQCEGEPAPGAIAIDAEIGRFKAKGDAVPAL